MPDIVERLRDCRTDDLVARHLMGEAADAIERLRYTLASWEAAAAVTRGSMAEPPVDDEPVRIVDAEPNTPR